jgi:hypothetical protein
MADHPGESEFPAAGFDTFDAFLRAAIKDYYDRGWTTRKGNFVALLIASGQTMGMARDALTGEQGLKRVAIGAAGLVALRIGLRFALGGPLGILLTGLSAASLAAYFVRNQKAITAKIPRYRELIASTRTKFEEIQTGYRANRYEARERNLMVDGLQKRFLADLDEN